MRARFLAGLAVVGLSSLPSIAFAQSGAEMAARRNLLEQAGAAREAGDHTRALELAERAGRISMTPSLRMFVAEEQQALGRFAPALGTADQCVHETERDANVRNRDAILARCRALLTELRTHVAYITLRVPDTHPQDLRVRVGGEVISDALYGVPYPVTPGDVAIDAAGNGVEAFHRQITIAAGASQDVDVALVHAATTTASSGGPTETVTGGNSTTVVTTTSTTITSNGGTTTANTGSGTATRTDVTPSRSPIVTYGPFVLGGLGLVALGTSIGLFVARNSAVNGCMVLTAEIVCFNEADYMRAQSAPTFNAVADVMLGVGIVALAGGVGWFVANRVMSRPRTEARQTSFLVVPSQSGLFLSLTRGF